MVLGLSLEAKLCDCEEVALIGGGNSAGQAVVFLSSPGLSGRWFAMAPGVMPWACDCMISSTWET